MFARAPCTMPSMKGQEGARKRLDSTTAVLPLRSLVLPRATPPGEVRFTPPRAGEWVYQRSTA